MKPSNTAHTTLCYEGLAILRSYGFGNYTYSGLKDLLLEKINKPSNKYPEPIKKEGLYNYQEISKMLIRLERLESIVEDYGNASGAIDGVGAARFLGVSKRTVDDLVAKNKIDSYQIGSRRLYRLSDLSRYRQNMVENNRQHGL